uniref:Uncharacterized protein n=1 Tax=Lepeophtheirus salmonis TaxID=72036 RepID=A0A0K2UCJ6_LEPSM
MGQIRGIWWLGHEMTVLLFLTKNISQVKTIEDTKSMNCFSNILDVFFVFLLSSRVKLQYNTLY